MLFVNPCGLRLSKTTLAMVKRDPTIYIFGSQHVLHYMVNIVGVYVILFLAYAPLQFAGFDIYAHAV